MLNTFSGVEREIHVDASSPCDRDLERIRDAVEQAVRYAIERARTAAAAFIKALSPAPATATEEAA
ncbi:hypothetical protein GOFOIKOB_0305 [Methylobacterium tardum]|jgi:hypothetical protein|uniref:Uncharacterized protein n=1 Tax=Methylobacterium tardum TaxID=374432 RepID=A0AA37TDL8_9HYPH|nr:hypothetical protein [Methylobacterium tardum]URD36851.1 hypothetical protein M6G65_31875 [Methylobacterium tardum]GJE47284.1 hypothetical protein GOFOIKOB_0305 [Methylobacterium tardum]GLS71345.1 hypothetical protein GCM10007890_33580 [Methylobacterium tardum]